MNTPLPPTFYAKDFIETAEGLLFAVVTSGLVEAKVLCFLRYRKQQATWQKLDTDMANSFLQHQHPEYLHYSHHLDAHLHAVSPSKIIHHHQPQQRLQRLHQGQAKDAVEADLKQLLRLLDTNGLDLAQLGITGSVLPGIHNSGSDLDLICYQRSTFQNCRAIIKKLLKTEQLQPLSDSDWQQSYQRRSCALSYSEYHWHEQRKLNKAMINNRKFDLSYIDGGAINTPQQHQKLGNIKLQCQVTDDQLAFDYPSQFLIDHPQIQAVVSFTATYTGQAQKGETIEVAGTLEQSPQGQRIVVGSSREAHGEYIKVIRD